MQLQIVVDKTDGFVFTILRQCGGKLFACISGSVDGNGNSLTGAITRQFKGVTTRRGVELNFQDAGIYQLYLVRFLNVPQFNTPVSLPIWRFECRLGGSRSQEI